MFFVNAINWTPILKNSRLTNNANFIRKFMCLSLLKDGILCCGKCGLATRTQATKLARCNMCGWRNLI